jgi:Fe-S cluster biogenesis protein NfuA
VLIFDSAGHNCFDEEFLVTENVLVLTHEETVAEIERILATLRPRIQADGGDVELVKYEQYLVYLRLHGACVHCPVSSMTVSFGLEVAIKEALPEVKGVEVID